MIYDTARTGQHKDRYSALAMAARYIAELENERNPVGGLLANMACCIRLLSPSNE